MVYVIQTHLKKRELHYTKITEVNLSVFVYRLFHDDFSPIVRTIIQSVYFFRRLERNLHETVCKQMLIN